MEIGKVACVKLLCVTLITSCVLAQNQTIILDRVDVRDNGTESFDNFLEKSVQMGALGDKKLSDLPFQVNIITSEVIKDQNYIGLEDAVKLLPSAQVEYRGGAEIGRPQTRGMRGDVVANSFWDGLHIASTTAIPMSLFEDMQVTNGIAGTAYGAQPAAGTFGFTLKRPTQPFEAALKTTYSNNFNLAQEVDLQGKSKYVGARTNFIYSDGEGSVKKSKLKRKLGSLALDFYPTDKLTIETNAIYYNYIKTGYAGIFFTAQNPDGSNKYKIPKAVDSSKRGLGQEFGGMDVETTTYSGKIKYDFAPDWYSQIGYLVQTADRSMYTPDNILIDNNGGIDVFVARDRSPGRFKIKSWMMLLGTKQDILSTHHDLTFGGNGYDWEFHRNVATNANDYHAGVANINHPVIFLDPGGQTNNKDFRRMFSSRVKSFTLSDTVKFNDNFHAMLSIGRSWFNDISYSTQTGVKTESSFQSGNSYAASIVYKPKDILSIYATYADTIVAGDSGENFDNTTVVLDPSRSTQYEVGVKAAFEKVNLSTAIFMMKRPIAYQGFNGIFSEQGEQRNYGFEFMGSAQAFEGLKLHGGFTYLNAKIKKALVQNINNKYAIGMPKWQANILGIYKLPAYKKISFDANLHFTGKRAVDQANTEWLGNHYTLDLGVKYATTNLLGKYTAFRLSVYNVTNQKYWASIFNGGGLDGEIGGGARMFLAEPRKIMATFEVKF